MKLPRNPVWRELLDIGLGVICVLVIVAFCAVAMAGGPLRIEAVIVDRHPVPGQNIILVNDGHGQNKPLELPHWCPKERLPQTIVIEYFPDQRRVRVVECSTL